MIWAMGARDKLEWHGNGRGTVSMYLIGIKAETPKLPKDIQTFDILKRSVSKFIIYCFLYLLLLRSHFISLEGGRRAIHRRKITDNSHLRPPSRLCVRYNGNELSPVLTAQNVH
jgi:hypothetical protein